MLVFVPLLTMSCVASPRDARSSSEATGDSASPTDDPGEFPRRPDEVYDRTDTGWDLPEGVVSSDRRGLRLRLGTNQQLATAAAPGEVGADDGVMVEGDLTLPRSSGSDAGVWCGTGPELDGGYAFVIGRDGGWGVFRYESGLATKVERGAVDPGDLRNGASTRVRLACGRSTTGGAVLGISYGDAPFVLVRDSSTVVGSWTRVGVLVSSVPAATDPIETIVRRVALRRARK